jgi:hypothetical protein
LIKYDRKAARIVIRIGILVEIAIG